MKVAGLHRHLARAQEPWKDPDIETSHDEMSGRLVTWSVDHEYRLNTPVGKRKHPPRQQGSTVGCPALATQPPFIPNNSKAQ